MIPELSLQSLGIAGAFITYLVYDRHILIKSLVQAIDRNTEALNTVKRKRQQ